MAKIPVSQSVDRDRSDVAGRSHGTGAALLRPAPERRLLWALLFGNFVVGTGVLLPAGMLTELAGGLDVSLPAAGSLLVASGVVVAIGAPLVAAVTSQVDRRLLLVASLLLYGLSHVLSAMAASFDLVFAMRMAMAVSAAIFTPQAASTLGALLPPERRSAAITFAFVGWSMATVGGVPLGGYVAHAFGWQTAFAIVAALSVMAAIAVWLTVPGGVRIAPLNAAAWRRVLTSPAMLLVLMVTILNGTGQFTFFTYLTPSLKWSLAAGAGLVTAVLAWYGVCATLGNVIAARMVAEIGAPRSALIALVSMTVGLVAWGLSAHHLSAVLVAATVWGLGTFATNSIQQARLANIAPDVASASIALNTSAIYLGQAAGSAFGGALIKADWLASLPFAGAMLLALAAGVSMLANRYEVRASRDASPHAVATCDAKADQSY